MSDQDSMSTGRLFALVALVIVCGICGLGGLFWMSRSTGTDCSVDEDCNSRACLRDGFSDHGVCTALCQSDDECPSEMRCAIVLRDRAATPGGSRERHMCVPR